MSDEFISDEIWAAIAPLLPGKDGDPGCSGRDNRLFLEAVFWVARTRRPWRALPPHFGKWYTTYTRYRRWEKKGVWPRVVEALQSREAREMLYGRNGLCPRQRARPRKTGPGRRGRAKGGAKALLGLRLGIAAAGRDPNPDLHRLP